MYKTRRQRLLKKFKKTDIIILPAANPKIRNGDVEYRYRQDSNFFYLTGFPEPKALAILLPEDNKFILFCQPNDPKQTIWNGELAGLTGAREIYQADEAYDINDLEKKLPELLRNKKRVYYPFSASKAFQDQVKAWIKPTAIQNIDNLDVLLHKHRLIKSDQEVELIKKAAEITALAHCRAMRKIKSLNYEYEVEAEIMHEFLKSGCRAEAYGMIVAGGKNACTLHYTSNQARLNSNELVLIDAGVEYQNYAADLTRTFPINGKFTAQQKDVYQIVLDAQLAGIKIIKIGANWESVQNKIIKILTLGLIDLGLLKGSIDNLIKTKAYKKYYMHNFGHWLGLDVHDVGGYTHNGRSRRFEKNMVLTVEPGLYIPEWNIGIRIEDDILVTDKKAEVLTAKAPREIKEIENLINS